MFFLVSHHFCFSTGVAQFRNSLASSMEKEEKKEDNKEDGKKEKVLGFFYLMLFLRGQLERCLGFFYGRVSRCVCYIRKIKRPIPPIIAIHNE